MSCRDNQRRYHDYRCTLCNFPHNLWSQMSICSFCHKATCSLKKVRSMDNCSQRTGCCSKVTCLRCHQQHDPNICRIHQLINKVSYLDSKAFALLKHVGLDEKDLEIRRMPENNQHINRSFLTAKTPLENIERIVGDILEVYTRIEEHLQPTVKSPETSSRPTETNFAPIFIPGDLTPESSMSEETVLSKDVETDSNINSVSLSSKRKMTISAEEFVPSFS